VQFLSLLSVVIIFATIGILLVRRYEVTYVLIISNLLVFMLGILAAFNGGVFGWVQFELGFRPSYLESGERLYTIITHMFVHASFLHVMMNMLFLFLIGTQLEKRIGRERTIAVYFLGGLVAVATESLLQWSPDSGFSTILMVGASGAVSALMGAMLLLYPQEEIPFFLGPIFMQRVKVWLSVGTWFLLQAFLLVAGMEMGVAYGAHVGGFLGGALIARVVVEGRTASIERPLDPQELQVFARTPRARKALDEVAKADEEDIRRAWMEEFAENATCPHCESRPEMRGNKLKCRCGLEVKWR